MDPADLAALEALMATHDDLAIMAALYENAPSLLASARREAALVEAVKGLLAFTDPLGVSEEPMNAKARAALGVSS